MKSRTALDVSLAVAAIVVLACFASCRSGSNTHTNARPKSPAPAPSAPPDYASAALDEGGQGPMRYMWTEPPEMYTSPERPDLPPLSNALRKRWRNIEFAAVSHNRKIVALCDGSAIRLTDAQGKHPRRLSIHLPPRGIDEDLLDSVSFSFRPDDGRVAVLVATVGGEPIIATTEILYTTDVASGRIRQLEEWGYSLQGAGPETADRRVTGWTADGKSVIVTGDVYNGVDMPSQVWRIGQETVNVKDCASRE